MSFHHSSACILLLLPIICFFSLFPNNAQCFRAISSNRNSRTTGVNSRFDDDGHGQEERQKLLNNDDDDDRQTEDAASFERNTAKPLALLLLKRRLPSAWHFEKKDMLPSFNLDTLAGIGLGKRSSKPVPNAIPRDMWRIVDDNVDENDDDDDVSAEQRRN